MENLSPKTLSVPEENKSQSIEPTDSIENLRNHRFQVLADLSSLKRKLHELDEEISARLEPVDSALMTTKRTKMYADPASDTQITELREILADFATKTNQRATYDRDFKIRIVNLAKVEGRHTVLKSFPEIAESCLSKWMSIDWENQPPITKRGRPLMHPEFDSHLRNAVLVLRKHNITLSARMLILNAKKLAIKKGIVDVKFSWGWLQNFLKRHQFSIRRSSRNYRQPDNLMNEAASIFLEKIRPLIIEKKYKPENILNMDETGVYRDSPFHSVIDIKGKRNVKIITGGHEKNRVTYVPTISMSGDELTALILLPGKGVRNKIGIKIPDDLKVVYTGASSAWMDSSIMCDNYINEVLKPFSRSLGPNDRALLLIDNFSAHKDEGFISKAKALGIDIEFLPPGSFSRWILAIMRLKNTTLLYGRNGSWITVLTRSKLTKWKPR